MLVNTPMDLPGPGAHHIPQMLLSSYSIQKVKLAVGVCQKSAGSFSMTKTILTVAGLAPAVFIPRPTNLNDLIYHDHQNY